MFLVKRPDAAIMNESQELITTASSDARKSPNNPGNIDGRNSFAMSPYTESPLIVDRSAPLLAYQAKAAMPVRHQAIVQNRLRKLPTMKPTRPSNSSRPAAHTPII